jgi:hypothetical protein
MRIKHTQFDFVASLLLGVMPAMRPGRNNI